MSGRQSEYTFAQVPSASIPRSIFNRSHGHKTAFNAGLLVPVFVDEVLPGDTFQMSASMFARLATPLVPVMDNMYLDVFFFFVPNRLLWYNWQAFCGEQAEPGDPTDFLLPVIEPTTWPVGSLGDYFGVPINVQTQNVNALPFRAYNLIWNEWFRDENLCARTPMNLGDGPDSGLFYALKRRGKRHDYFTSCLPWPQKGPGVTLPIGGTAPVALTMDPVAGAGVPTFMGAQVTALNIDANPYVIPANAAAGPSGNLAWQNPSLTVTGTGVADLSSATAATINSLRQAFQVQKLLERDARGGTRYVEILRSHFGVVSPDARLQRPEYLGGGTVPVMINPVAQSSATGIQGGATPLGRLGGYGVGAGKGLGFSKSFVEHGYVMGLACVRADLSYQQGLHRMWSRRTRYDFYWPAFANLGEQAVLSKEIYCAGTPVQDDGVFGYQERWAEYRYFPSKITGILRGTAAANLSMWHLAQTFGSRPVLGEDFIQENPPIDRVVAVPSEPQFIFDSFFRLKCTRPMPAYSVPGMIDHF